MLKYINLYNLAGTLVGAFALSSIALNYFSKNMHFIFRIALCQSFYILEVLNILTNASKSRLFPTCMQLSSRLFIIWCICYRYGFADAVVHIMLLCWFVSDTVRYLFYFSRNGTVKFLRYNLFIVLYPLGTLCEIVLVSRVERACTGVLKYFLRVVMLCYIPGFSFLYVHMIRRRRWTDKNRSAAQRKKDK
ncbi:hypothetical protein VCUG_00317 [Vavraia culicis subsp. floridensis]|uniref:Very-long-chain (3R)-3-hydroxyacyl-CoA dehydratase n=1 Tax=Vavraia culicis (isolate floridensis) TaxID=948595 RepID=L2GX65_VAVCU|nr:uncharacterized protein VCUG_00317 [Vavraia culicis subsp. floridensis]ELA48276.1 hypothetical protein VCUG_00317 [Vavraia culicis subsp. floridensis]